MSLFTMGIIIFICGIVYRVVVFAEKNNDVKIIDCDRETKTITGGIE